MATRKTQPNSGDVNPDAIRWLLFMATLAVRGARELPDGTFLISSKIHLVLFPVSTATTPTLEITSKVRRRLLPNCFLRVEPEIMLFIRQQADLKAPRGGSTTNCSVDVCLDGSPRRASSLDLPFCLLFFTPFFWVVHVQEAAPAHRDLPQTDSDTCHLQGLQLQPMTSSKENCLQLRWEPRG